LPPPDYPEVDTIEERNQEEAMGLLAEAGYPQGRGLPELVIRIPAGGESERIAGIMADAWQEALGMSVRLDPVDYSVYFASLKRDDYAIGQMTWIGDFADPLTFLQMWTSDSNLNDAHYRNTEYDELVEEGTAISDMEDRYDLFARAESIILRTGVILPVSHQPSLNLVDTDRIEGWYPNFLDVHPFKFIRFKGPRVFPNLVMR
jgi:peptide/nickel transport system substrate-binding protein/oligopeptide transport system substrate-binding protein